MSLDPDNKIKLIMVINNIAGGLSKLAGNFIISTKTRSNAIKYATPTINKDNAEIVLIIFFPVILN